MANGWRRLTRAGIPYEKEQHIGALHSREDERRHVEATEAVKHFGAAPVRAEADQGAVVPLAADLSKFAVAGYDLATVAPQITRPSIGIGPEVIPRVPATQPGMQVRTGGSKSIRSGCQACVSPLPFGIKCSFTAACRPSCNCSRSQTSERIGNRAVHPPSSHRCQGSRDSLRDRRVYAARALTVAASQSLARSPRSASPLIQFLHIDQQFRSPLLSAAGRPSAVAVRFDLDGLLSTDLHP